MRTGCAQTTTARYLHNRDHRITSARERASRRRLGRSRDENRRTVGIRSRLTRESRAKIRRQTTKTHSRSVCLARQSTGNGRAGRLMPRSKRHLEFKPRTHARSAAIFVDLQPEIAFGTQLTWNFFTMASTTKIMPDAFLSFRRCRLILWPVYFIQFSLIDRFGNT